MFISSVLCFPFTANTVGRISRPLRNGKTCLLCFTSASKLPVRTPQITRRDVVESCLVSDTWLTLP